MTSVLQDVFNGSVVVLIPVFFASSSYFCSSSLSFSSVFICALRDSISVPCMRVFSDSFFGIHPHSFFMSDQDILLMNMRATMERSISAIRMRTG